MFFFTFLLLSCLSSANNRCQALKVPNKKPLQTLSTLYASAKGTLKDFQIHVSNESGLLRKAQLIDEALPNSTVSMAYFIYENDYSSSYLTQKIIQKATNKNVHFQILVDYFMAENFLPLYHILDTHPNIQVQRFRAPTPEFLSFLKNQLQIAEPMELLRGMMLSDNEKIMQQISSSPLLQQLLAQIPKMKTEEAQGESAPGTLMMSVLLQKLQEQKTQEAVYLATQLEKHLVEFSRRLHHKLMLVQTSEGLKFITGGRNISDEYHLSLGHEFLKERNYPFFDAEVSGTMQSDKANQMQASFSRLWRNPNLTTNVGTGTDTEIQTVTQEMNSKAGIFEATLSSIQIAAARGTIKGISSSISYIENLPGTKQKYKMISKAWVELLDQAQTEVTIVSAYFHLFPALYEAIKKASIRGVRITIYTNSFTSTDMNMVNVATYQEFAQWQKDLGPNVAIQELNRGPKEGSLHAKFIVIDKKIVGIGSANFDPRTNELDTNNVVFMDLSYDPKMVKAFTEAYIGSKDHQQTQSDYGLGLAWTTLTQNYVNAIYKKIEETKKRLTQALKTSFIRRQL